MHELPLPGGLDRLEQGGQPPLGAGQFLIARREHAAGDEHLPQMPGGPRPRMRIKRLVGGGGPPGGQIGEDGRAGPGT